MMVGLILSSSITKKIRVLFGRSRISSHWLRENVISCRASRILVARLIWKVLDLKSVLNLIKKEEIVILLFLISMSLKHLKDNHYLIFVY